MNRPSLFSFLFSLLAVSSCVVPYQPETQQIDPKALIIEGEITDQPGPYTVRLSRTGDYTNSGLNFQERGAIVTIQDDRQTSEVLQETAPGVYATRATGIRGVAGRSYRLLIQTKDGKRYQSEAELLKAAPPIKNLYYEFREDPLAGTSDKRSGWEVYVDVQDSPETGDFYRWEWAHYEYTSVCRSVLTIPEPETFQDYPCCTDCWNIERCYTCLNVGSDALINGKVLSRQPIMRVPFTSFSRYYLEVEQQAISRGAYQFWKSVRQLINNTGGLFDAAPALVRGNIRSVANPDELVFGFFGATGITVAPLWVDRSSGIGTPPPRRLPNFGSFPPPCTVCENSNFRTPNKPRWWQL